MAKIRELVHADIRRGAEILASSEPWTTADEDQESLEQLLLPAVGRGVLYGAEEDSSLAALVYFFSEPVFAMGGLIRFLVVRADMRRRGIGRQLMGFVERKVFDRSSNIYVCVSSFNEPALRFFEKLGYRKVGEVSDLIVAGHSEWILRKADTGSSRRRARLASHA